MKKRFNNHLYTKEILVFKDHRLCCIESPDGTLFSSHHRTKIIADDLPDWYVFGRHNKCWGYLSTKGITDLIYISNKFTNHFLKDDCLYIAYGGSIKKEEASGHTSFHPSYSGFDERVWGNEIIGILKGARLYSSYDISAIVQQLKKRGLVVTNVSRGVRFRKMEL